MNSADQPPAMRGLIEFLGELGQRWGLPPEACRVHGYLYLVSRPVGEAELGDKLKLDDAKVADALVWLLDFRLVAHAPDGTWQTGRDPWELLMRGLQERRQRELGPALDVLRECHRVALADRARDRTIPKQIGKLLALAEDLAAIGVQAQRLSPHTLRQMVGMGGRAARLIGRTTGKGRTLR